MTSTVTSKLSLTDKKNNSNGSRKLLCMNNKVCLNANVKLEEYDNDLLLHVDRHTDSLLYILPFTDYNKLKVTMFL